VEARFRHSGSRSRTSADEGRCTGLPHEVHDRDDARVRIGTEGCAEGSVADATENGRHWLGTARAADRSVLRGVVEKEVSHGAHLLAFSDYFWGAPFTSMLVARLI